MLNNKVIYWILKDVLFFFIVLFSNVLTVLLVSSGEPNKEPETKRRSSKSNSGSNRTSTDSNGETRASKKRSKNEIDDISSPEVDKRQKRNASVKAQSIITKQVCILMFLITVIYLFQ